MYIVIRELLIIFRCNAHIRVMFSKTVFYFIRLHTEVLQVKCSPSWSALLHLFHQQHPCLAPLHRKPYLPSEKMELTQSKSAQCPTPASTNRPDGQTRGAEEPFLPHKADPLPKPGSNTLPSRTPPFMHLQLHSRSRFLCVFSLVPLEPCLPLRLSSSPPLLFSQTAHLFSLLCSPFTLKPAFCPIMSGNCSQKAHQWTWLSEPTGSFKAWLMREWSFLPSFMRVSCFPAVPPHISLPGHLFLPLQHS